MDLNKIMLAGRLGKDPVQRSTKTGKPVVNFSLGTSHRIKKGEQDGVPQYEDETLWHNVVVWGKFGDFCVRHLSKGAPAFIVGELRTRKYTSNKGEPRLSVEVHAENVVPLGAFRRSGDGSRKDKEVAPEIGGAEAYIASATDEPMH